MVDIEEKDAQVLEILTRNCRANINSIARHVGISRTTAAKRLKRVTKEYGLKYVLAVDRHKLGINFNVMIRVKFSKEIPEKELKAILAKSYIPQFAALTKGDFDLLIFASAHDNNEFDEWEVQVRKELDEYIEDWNALTVLNERFGFFPPSQKLLERAKLKPVAKKIIEILNKDVRVPIREIAKQLKMSSPLVKYHLKKLEKSKLFDYRLVLTERIEPDKLIVFNKFFVPKTFHEINQKFRSFLKANSKNICYAARMLGSSDFCTISSFGNMDKLYAFQAEFRKASEKMSRRYDSSVILKTVIGELRINPFEAEEKYSAPAY